MLPLHEHVDTSYTLLDIMSLHQSAECFLLARTVDSLSTRVIESTGCVPTKKKKSTYLSFAV